MCIFWNEHLDRGRLSEKTFSWQLTRRHAPFLMSIMTKICACRIYMYVCVLTTQRRAGMSGPTYFICTAGTLVYLPLVANIDRGQSLVSSNPCSLYVKAFHKILHPIPVRGWKLRKGGGHILSLIQPPFSYVWGCQVLFLYPPWYILYIPQYQIVGLYRLLQARPCHNTTG